MSPDSFSKHHATYVNNLNVAEEKCAEAAAKGDISAVIGLGPALKFNGGGHLNHRYYPNPSIGLVVDTVHLTIIEYATLDKTMNSILLLIGPVRQVTLNTTL